MIINCLAGHPCCLCLLISRLTDNNATLETLRTTVSDLGISSPVISNVAVDTFITTPCRWTKKWVCVMGSQIYTILQLRWQLPLLTSCVYEEVQICKLLKREDKCRQLKWHCAHLLRLPIKWLVTWSQELPGQWWCFRKDESTWISLQKLQMAGAMD